MKPTGSVLIHNSSGSYIIQIIWDCSSLSVNAVFLSAKYFIYSLPGHLKFLV